MSAPIMLVWLETKDGVIRPASLEAVTAASRVAGALGAELSGVLTGPDAKQVAAGAGAYGMRRAYVTESPLLETFSQEGYATAVAAAVKAAGATHVFMGHTVRGRELAPRLAQRLDAGLASDLISIEAADGRVLGERPIYGGKLIARVAVRGTPAVYSLRPKAFARAVAAAGATAGASASASAEVVEVPFVTPPSGVRTKWTGFLSTSKARMDVAEADFLVSGGRGVRGPEGFRMLEELADLLGGAVSCSRPVSEQGWRAHGDHVGQTGKTVSPTLYIACGISGAIQHMAGVSSSRVIVAINKDSNAPIFERADYGIVGDLFEVLPRLTEEIRKLQKAG